MPGLAIIAGPPIVPTPTVSFTSATVKDNGDLWVVWTVADGAWSLPEQAADKRVWLQIGETQVEATRFDYEVAGDDLTAKFSLDRVVPAGKTSVFFCCDYGAVYDGESAGLEVPQTVGASVTNSSELSSSYGPDEGFVYYVRHDGSTGADGSNSNYGSEEFPFLTIAFAITQMTAGDVCRIDGTFYEMSLILAVQGTLEAWPGATWQPQIVGGRKIAVAWTGPSSNIYTAVVDLGAAWRATTKSGANSGQPIGLTADYGIVDGVTKRMLTDARGNVRPYGHLQYASTISAAGQFKVVMAGSVATITARLFGDADPNTKTMVVCVSDETAIPSSGTGLGIGLYLKADRSIVRGIWFNRFMCWDTGQGYAIQGGYGAFNGLTNGGCLNCLVDGCRFSDTGWHAVGWPNTYCQSNTIQNCIFDHTNGDNGSGDYGIPTVFRSGNASVPSPTVGPQYVCTGRVYGCSYRCSRPILESGIGYLTMPAGSTSLAGAHINHTAPADSPVGDVEVQGCVAAYDVANDLGAGSPLGAKGSPWRALNGQAVAAADRANFGAYGNRYDQCVAYNVDRTETGDNVYFRRCDFRYDFVNASIQAMIACNATFGSQITTAGYDAIVTFDACSLVCSATASTPSLCRFASYTITGANSTRVQRFQFLNCTLILNYTARMVGFQNSGVGTVYLTGDQSVFDWPQCTAVNNLFLFDDVNKVITPTFTACWYPVDARFGGAASASFASNTAYNTRNKWSGVDTSGGAVAIDTIGVYNTVPSFASRTTSGEPSANGNLQTARLSPAYTFRSFLGINGQESAGNYGAWQYPASIRGRTRNRARTRLDL